MRGASMAADGPEGYSDRCGRRSARGTARSVFAPGAGGVSRGAIRRLPTGGRIPKEAPLPDPILRRPLDLALVVFFSVSVVYGFLFSLPEGLGVPVSADSPWPPLRAP